MSSAPHPLRDVVSYVRRSTRMNPSQQRAWDNYREQFVIPVASSERDLHVDPQASIDWDSTFGRQGPLVVEIGSGAGDSLAPMAAAQPDRNFVAFEVFLPAVASTLGRLHRLGVRNVRVVLADGAQALPILFADGQVSELWTFFADPWHKTRHHKRRLVQPAFADRVADKLEGGGLWRLATDWQDYALWMREQLDPHPDFENINGGWAQRFAQRPVTKYEAKGLAAGRQVFDLTYRRRT